ncbi:hypothetical protein AJ80_03209 [Polytolypa hystricis UAMH7299]|uniref:Uncharacterized protein n=1 Tax=Polytolypa hystricis (strain UAMH7299) TaxID=1447883 RepID=A0A2B7YKQ6_POLH7|nr:hypothetical protein AJ80_03209 [Polytolypa hystricis UAMH7299]
MWKSMLSLALLLLSSSHAQSTTSALPSSLSTPANRTVSAHYAVVITYSRCTSTVSRSQVDLPAITKTVPVYPSDDAGLTPISTYTAEVTFFDASATTSPVAIVQPADVDPIEFAYQSNHYQPSHCLLAVASKLINYRDACETGPSDRKPRDPGYKCGDLNPCCFDCSIMVRARDGWADCADGIRYWSDGDTQIQKYRPATASPTSAGWTVHDRTCWISAWIAGVVITVFLAI